MAYSLHYSTNQAAVKVTIGLTNKRLTGEAGTRGFNVLLFAPTPYNPHELEVGRFLWT